MRRKTFIKIFTLALCLILVVFVAGLIGMHQTSKRMTEDRLVTECSLVSNVLKNEIANGDSTDMDTLLKSLKAHYREDEFRITVIKTDGTVIYDSEPGKDEGEYETHLDREEIKYALNGESKTVERYSDSFDCTMTYYAEKVELGSYGDIVLRLAVRSSEITEYVYVSLSVLLVALIVAIIVSAWFSAIISKDVSTKISQVAYGLKSLNDGEYVPIEINSNEPELRSVYAEINELNAYVHAKIVSEEQEKRKLNEVLDNVTQGIIVFDDENRVVFANNSALTLFNNGAGCVGKKLFYLISDLKLVEKITTFPTQNTSFEYRLEDKDLTVTVKRILDSLNPENVASSIVIITDTTPEKQMVKQKSDFFANASHELKTPITVMQGLAEISLSKEGLEPSTKKSMERIHKESLRMASLISDMLKLSKLERNDTEETLTTVDLEAIAKEVIAELDEKIERKKIAVTILGNGEVQADPMKIYELISNLVSNAVSYNKENGRLDIIITNTSSSVTLKVIDTGIGIEKEHIPRLCERFYRVDKSRSKKTGGTGLGLAIVKHICALYNAKMKIESEIDKGTEVEIVFTK
ncbi:MAG: PAS domain-containing protein [Clostridia bacterium]|nr:PAS domain-containing protein [Clostridia bacterium]